jgi:hypothetical protein
VRARTIRDISSAVVGSCCDNMPVKAREQVVYDTAFDRALAPSWSRSRAKLAKYEFAMRRCLFVDHHLPKTKTRLARLPLVLTSYV